MSTNVQRFIELQTQVNNQIDTVGQADFQLVDELELLGDSLDNDEINEVCEWYNNVSEVEMEYEDIEWMIE